MIMYNCPFIWIEIICLCIINYNYVCMYMYMDTHMWICICICICVCVCIYIYIYVCIYSCILSMYQGIIWDSVGYIYNHWWSQSALAIYTINVYYHIISYLIYSNVTCTLAWTWCPVPSSCRLVSHKGAARVWCSNLVPGIQKWT